MAPASNQRYGRLSRPGSEELLVGSIAVALQDTSITATERAGVRVPQARRVIVNHRRQIIACPMAGRECGLAFWTGSKLGIDHAIGRTDVALGSSQDLPVVRSAPRLTRPIPRISSWTGQVTGVPRVWDGLPDDRVQHFPAHQPNRGVASLSPS
jgi:hypothetical protein